MNNSFLLKGSRRIIWVKFGPLIVVFISLFLVASGYFWVISPRIKIYQANAAYITTQNRYLQDLQTQDALLNQRIQELASWQTADLSAVEKMLPKTVDRSALIIELNELVSSIGFEVKSLKIEEDVPVPSATPLATKDAPQDSTVKPSSQSEQAVPLKITLQVAGSDYDGFKALLKKLETYERLIHIESFQFVNKADTTSSQAESGVINLILKTYFFKD